MNPAILPTLYDQPERVRHGDRVQLFVSHDHDDVTLAAVIVHAIELAFEVPHGAIRCTSVPGYQLALGARAADVLRQELSNATVVIALLTPASLKSAWVMFELGAAWVLTTHTIPLLGEGVRDDAVPAALQGAIAGHLTDPNMGVHFLDQLGQLLGWPEGNRTAALGALEALP